MVDLADRGDDLAPAGIELLGKGKLQPDAERLCAVCLGHCRHLHDPGLVVAKEAVPFLFRLEIDFATPEKLCPPIGNVRDEHDRQAALARPIERLGDVAKVVVVAETDMAVLLNLGVGMNRDAVYA